MPNAELLADLYARLEQWECESHPWKDSNGDPVKDPALVRRLTDADREAGIAEGRRQAAEEIRADQHRKTLEWVAGALRTGATKIRLPDTGDPEMEAIIAGIVTDTIQGMADALLRSLPEGGE